MTYARRGRSWGLALLLVGAGAAAALSTSLGGSSTNEPGLALRDYGPFEVGIVRAVNHSPGNPAAPAVYALALTSGKYLIFPDDQVPGPLRGPHGGLVALRAGDAIGYRALIGAGTNLEETTNDQQRTLDIEAYVPRQ